MKRASLTPQSLTQHHLQKTSLAQAIGSIVLAGSIATPSLAQTLEEIVVTATKRQESVMDVPLSVTALSGDFIREVDLKDVKDLVSYTPGVTGNSQDSFIDAISIRGIRTQDYGIGGDPSAAFFKNDLYEGRNGAAVTSLYDIERAEILRGPQGFLFGRNAIGGAFSVYTKQADIDGGNSGYVDVDVAENDHYNSEGALNIPVNDVFAMRIAGYYGTEDGFVDNKYNGDHLIEYNKYALRWSTAFSQDNLSISTMVEFEDRNQSGSVYRAVDTGATWETLQAALGEINLQGGKSDVDSDQYGGDDDNADILTTGLRIDYEMDWVTLTSNTGYKDHDYYYNEDYDGTPLNINNFGLDQSGEYFQQELRLTSGTDNALSWYAGVSYYKEDIDTRFSFIGAEDYMCQYYGYYYNGQTFAGCVDLYAYYGYEFTPSADGTLTETSQVKGDYSGWASYVDLSYKFSDKLDASLGIRYTVDEKDFSMNVPTPESQLGAYWAFGFSTDGFVENDDSWDEVTGRGIVRYFITDSAMVFGSYTQGYKSGGFGSFVLGNNPQGDSAIGNLDLTQADGFLPDTFEPETIDSWEMGYKDTLFDGRTQVTLSTFLYDYSDLQVVVADGGAVTVDNVGNVDGMGIGGSITSALGEHYQLYANLSWLDTEAKDLQNICELEDPNACEGRKLFWAPEWSGSVVFSANFPVENGAIVASVEAFGESERGGGWEDLQETQISPFLEISARLGYESNDNWSVVAYVENLNDETNYDGVNNNGGILPAAFFGPKRPRTFGVRVGYSWD